MFHLMLESVLPEFDHYLVMYTCSMYHNCYTMYIFLNLLDLKFAGFTVWNICSNFFTSILQWEIKPEFESFPTWHNLFYITYVCQKKNDKFVAIYNAFYDLHRCLIEDCVAVNSDILAWWKQSEFAVQDILFDTVLQNL
jgi:hypothetical protein